MRAGHRLDRPRTQDALIRAPQLARNARHAERAAPEARRCQCGPPSATLSGQLIATLPQTTTASDTGQFGVTQLSQSILGTQNVAAQDGADGLTSNPLTFDLPLPLYGPATAVQ